MGIDNYNLYAVSIGGGFFAGILLGYAMKKTVKIAAVIVGLFIAGLIYLQSQQITTINWDKFEQLSEGAAITLANVTAMIDSSSSSNNYNDSGLGLAAISNFGSIPLTIGSMSAGFSIGFLKG
ncbi:MAG TPA: FUN14 domain-containing protein [Nitrososphaeraceae archaeon]|nr:FUN14 domain-containing protein [Nitrososphaeraceae archaeon]